MKLYEYVDKAIYNYASCYDAPDKNSNEKFSDALVDVIELIKNSFFIPFVTSSVFIVEFHLIPNCLGII